MTGDSDLFAFPAVRNHLSFTAERAFVTEAAAQAWADAQPYARWTYYEVQRVPMEAA